MIRSRELKGSPITVKISKKLYEKIKREKIIYSAMNIKAVKYVLHFIVDVRYQISSRLKMTSANFVAEVYLKSIAATWHHENI